MGIESCDIEVHVDIDCIKDGVIKQIKGHMDVQPWKIVCADCGEVVDHSSSVDAELDLTIEVTPCKCTQQED